ncbi:MAG: ATP-binding cassette domain-containing protein, partial [Candidatus Rokubacteria bacterium]|nr:ATP-binding cassette domain-containing protein [Candidatus Rokubacteria bacterium]
MLEVQNLRYAYRGIRAVSDVSLRVGAGEIVALIGANGAGKSTSVKMIAGALRPDAG